MDGNVSFCDICTLSFRRRAWGETLAFARCWIVFSFFVCMGALGVIYAFYLK